MKNFARLFSAALVVGAIVGSSHHAHAAPPYSVTYVSTSGTGDCGSIATACSNIGTAIANTTDGGLVTCISGGAVRQFVTITQSITVDCAAAGYTITQLIISAPGKTVKIQGLTLNSGTVGNPTLDILAAATVTIKDSRIGNPQPNGNNRPPCLIDERNSSGILTLINTLVPDCGGVGILIAPSGGNVAAVLDNVQSVNSSYGVAVATGSRVMIDRSTFSGNSAAGIEADYGAIIGLANSLVSNNNIGVQAGGTVSIANSEINSNNKAISGATQSYGNNRIFANVSDGTQPAVIGQR